MNLNERLASPEMIGPNTSVYGDAIIRRRPIVCVDGFTMSVQANEGCYCIPRRDKGPWISVEVWYQGQSNPQGWVPVEEVEHVIESHGGFSHYGEIFQSSRLLGPMEAKLKRKRKRVKNENSTQFD